MGRPVARIGASIPLILLLTWTTGCSRGRAYELRGQVLAVDKTRQEITVKHEDIHGFMPGMTMPFRVKDPALLDGRSAGELIRARLVIEESSGYLETIESVGRAPVTEPPPPPRIEALSLGDRVPDVPLIDSAGRPRGVSAWRNQALAVTFIYTRCPIPDFCPAMDRRFADAQEEVQKDPGLKGRVHLLSISFDPEFDTPAVLAKHASHYAADPEIWTFATGEKDRIDRFAAAFGLRILREGQSPEVMHNLRTAVIDGDGLLVALLNGNEWRTADLIDALRRAIAAKTGSASGGR
jgi:protein SCO1/2